MEVLFPFGHGLSYTEFLYDNLVIEREKIKDTDNLFVKVDIINAGNVTGKEIVQLYISPSDKGVAIRPIKELKGYDKIELKPGEKKTVCFDLNNRSFAYFNTDINDWYIEEGSYGILIGSSSRDIKISGAVSVESTKKSPYKIHFNSTVNDVKSTTLGLELISPILEKYVGILNYKKKKEVNSEMFTDEMLEAIINDLPLRSLVSFTRGKITEKEIVCLIEKLNA